MEGVKDYQWSKDTNNVLCQQAMSHVHTQGQRRARHRAGYLEGRISQRLQQVQSPWGQTLELSEEQQESQCDWRQELESETQV